MHRVRRKGRQAHGDVLRTLGIRRAVLDPFARTCDNRLASVDIERAVAVDHAQRASQDDRVFFELRRLARLDPAGGALHMGDADCRGAGVYATDVLADDLWFIASRNYFRRTFN